MSSSDTHKCAVEVVFTGRVQGVGFRYTTLSIAGAYAVSGYVKNMPSGEVKLFAQGEEPEVDAFIADICRRMDRYIQGHTVTVVPPDPRVKDFRVAY